MLFTRRSTPVLLTLFLQSLVTGSAAAQTPDASPPDHWSGFRGQSGGHTKARRLPQTWSERENVAWSVVPTGMGQSSPCVWGDRVFVTSVFGPEKELCVVSCYRLRDGLLLWSRTAEAGCKIKSTKMVSRGAPTPAVDAKRVYAFFESGDVLAFRHDGQLEWRTSLVESYGAFQGNHGIGSSVLLTEHGVVLLIDHSGPSYLLCLDRRTGAVRWKTNREKRVSWATPTVRTVGGAQEIVVSSNGELAGFRSSDGQRVWGLSGLTGNTVPSPVIAGDLVIVGASKAAGNLAVRPAGEKTAIAWKSKARPLGFASPTVIAGGVLFLNKAGSLAYAKLDSGDIAWKHRTPEGCWASPIVAGNRVYLFGKAGTTTVLDVRADGARVLATNTIETEDTVYGVAAVEANLIMREGKMLRCLRVPAAAPTAAAGEAKPASGTKRRD